MFRRGAGQCGNLGGAVNERVQCAGPVAAAARIEVRVDVDADAGGALCSRAAPTDGVPWRTGAVEQQADDGE